MPDRKALRAGPGRKRPGRPAENGPNAPHGAGKGDNDVKRTIAPLIALTVLACCAPAFPAAAADRLFQLTHPTRGATRAGQAFA